MVFQITNSCNMMCPHCMDSCVPCDQHMSEETFAIAKHFAHQSGSRVVLISGGELTHNPLFGKFTRECAKEFPIVAFLSNGEWIGSEKEKEVVDILKCHSNVSIQLTNVKGLYRKYEETEKKVEAFKKVLRDNGLKHRMAVADRIESMVALGRATEHEGIMEEARHSQHTMSCFASALIAAQLPYVRAIDNMERRGKFCHPLVDWKGDLHWSESVLCPSFANINEPFDVICDKAQKWRPCCKCADFKKLVAKQDEKYRIAMSILGIMSEKGG